VCAFAAITNFEGGRMSTTHQLQAVFWLGLAAFLSWDFMVSAPVDLRNEPPLIAAGSGQAASGGHCSMAK
jgi:hypothetical protein